MNSRDDLVRLGLTNQHADMTVGPEVASRVSRAAYCASSICAPGRRTSTAIASIRKPSVVSTDDWLCPDCGHALIWKTKRVPG